MSEYVAHATDANLGEVFVRYVFKKDAVQAKSVMNNSVIDGSAIKVEEVLPRYWPTNTTRRFF